MVRASTVLVMLTTARILLAALPAAAAGNPHNLGSCSACHPTTPRFGIDARRDVTFTTSADDPGLCAPCHSSGQHEHPVLVPAGSGPAGASCPMVENRLLTAWAADRERIPGGDGRQ